MTSELIERLGSALAFDARIGTDAQWSELMAQATNAKAALEASSQRIKELEADVERLKDAGSWLAIRTGELIAATDGLFPAERDAALTRMKEMEALLQQKGTSND